MCVLPLLPPPLRATHEPQVKAAAAAVVLVAMYFTGHIQRAYDRSEGDGSIPMLSSFLIFMSLSVM